MRVIAALLALVAAQTCLPDGLPENERRNLTYPGYNGPIVDSNPWWASAQVLHGMAKILLTEVLGYTYVNKFSVPSSVMFVLGPMGCKEMFAFNDCLDYDEWAPQIHYGLEGWGSATSAYSKMPPERRSVMLSKHAYKGVESIFIRGAVDRAAYADDHLILSTYKGWNATAFPQIKDHFSGGLGGTKALLDAAGVPMQTLASTPSANSHDNYLGATGDNGPACFDSATSTLTADPAETCQGDWWVTPACRADPDSCIPVITSAGWGEAEFRQFGAFYDMPLAITDTTWGGYVAAISQVNVAFYWWYPDATFADVDPKQIKFPSWNVNEHKEGIYKTEMPDADLTRYVWPHLDKADKGRGANIVYVLDRMALYLSDIDLFMTDFGLGMNGEEIACEFLQTKAARWADWIPDLNACIAGEGWDADLEECVECPAGSVSQMDGDINNRLCSTCLPGTYCAKGSTVPAMCMPGFECPDSGMGNQEECAPGKEQPQPGQTSCTECKPGHYSEIGGATCNPCPVGFFNTEDGQTKCVRCSARSFQDEEGQKMCKPCKTGYTSSPGSDNLGACVCPLNTFFSESRDECVRCQEGGVCLEGMAVPFVQEGFYAEEKATAWKGEYILKPNSVEWEYTTDAEKRQTLSKADGALFDSLTVWKCPYGARACPGRTLTSETGFEAKMSRKVDECADKLFENGCSRCPAEHYFNSEAVTCLPCTGGDTALYPMIYVAGLLAMLALYKVMRYHGSQKLTNMLMFSCSASLLVNFFQMLGIIGFYNVQFPTLLEGFFDFFKLFVFDLDVLRAACALGSEFSSRFMTRTVSPLVFMLSFLSLLPISKVFSMASGGKFEAMDSHNIINASGLITNAGYIALCKVTMQYYECRSQPSAPSTVTAYPDVNCNSEEHAGMFGLAVFTTMLYGAGIYLVSLYLCWVAPTRMVESMTFRRRTRFLVGRWNPGRWYWGPVLQTRNLLVSLVAVAYPSDGVMQLVVTGALVVTYTCAQSTMEPWRDLFLNITDSILGLAITLTCMFGVLLVADVGATESRALNASGYLTFIFAASFLSLAYALGRAVYFLLFTKKSTAKDMAQTQAAAKVLLLQTKRLYQLCNDGQDEGVLADALSTYLTVSEQKQIYKVGKVVLHEMCGVKYHSEATYRRLMINKIEESVDLDTLLADNGDVEAPRKMLKPSRVSALSRLGGGFR